MPPPGMLCYSLSQLAALQKTETSECYFLAYDVNFPERSGAYPAEFIANYYKDLGVTIGMSHL